MKDRKLKNDYTKKKIGHLLIIDVLKDRTKGIRYDAICDCGKKRIVTYSELRRAERKDYEISCNDCTAIRNRWNISVNKQAFFSLYTSYKRISIITKKEFNISCEEFENITSCNCYYCGIKPLQIRYNHNKKGMYIYNGIDRLNPKLGYIRGNIVPCCKACNYMKQSMTELEFIIHLQKILKHLCL